MMMCDGSSSSSASEFEIGVGRALDVLRKDYPFMLTEQPNLSIYCKDVEFVDPSGVRLHGLSAYKNSFRLLHAIVKFIYCPARSSLTFRMCFDQARNNIRIHWNAEVVPREIFGGSRTTAHVDGISIYELDAASGNITQHRIEHLLMNNLPVRPKEGVIAALRNQHAVTVPSFARNQIAEFQSFSPEKSGSSLFAMEGASENGAEDKAAGVDWDALERKNLSRKKFGLQPLTAEEFLELEAQVKQMDLQQRQSAASNAAEMSGKQKSKNFFEKMLGDVLDDTCDSNFDCERPEVCCDFGFKKMCCSSGTPVVNGFREYAMVPVPVDVNMPGDDSRSRRYY